MFTLKKQSTLDDVEMEIIQCESEHHIQQAIYSTYHKGLTQICFTCKCIRTNINVP